mmetsp:Transcript_32687/g.37188  ORF Transcript_32687/g.37188 Transcript_32687/m.37188 type:complete len:489 (+) Transcript_32687:104-1570(+)
MKFSQVAVFATIVTTTVGFDPSSITRRQPSMALGTFDLKRRQKFNKILKEVRVNPTKEVVEKTLLNDDTSDLIKKCNWKLRKAMIRKVNKMAREFGGEVEDGFGIPLTQEDWEAKKRQEKVSYLAVKKAKLEATAEAEKQRKEKKSAKKAKKAANMASIEGKIKKSKLKEESTETATKPVVIESTNNDVEEVSKSVEAREVTVLMIKELREETGAGMMDCKRALVENNGDDEAARDYLRMKGLAKADKKASRVASEGKIVVAKKENKSVMVEVNCETDFVARDTLFTSFANSVATAALEVESEEISSLTSAEIDGSTIEDSRQALVAKIGENIQVRRFVCREGAGNNIGSYVHMDRIGVMVEIEGGSEDLAESIAMHVAAMNPLYAVPEDVPGDVVEKEREILKAQALESGKPPEIVDKMIEGRIRKYLEEICLVSQTYVRTNDRTVGKLLEENGAKMVGFTRIAVGEGIKKKEDNFAEEVAQMTSGN